jgi:proline-rich protein PRCC
MDEPSRLAKRKHQITSLFAAAKAREAEYGGARAASQKSKAETAAKYGW